MSGQNGIKMTEFENFRLPFVEVDDSSFLIEDHEFHQASFSDFSIGPCIDGGACYEIHRCSFVNCQVLNGRFMVRAGVSLRGVVLDGVSVRDGLVFSSSAVLEDVVVKDRANVNDVWVRPDEDICLGSSRMHLDRVEDLQSKIQTMIDVRSVQRSAVTIMGIPLSKVARDPSIHVVVSRKWLDSEHWDEIRLRRGGFWRNRLRYLRSFGVREGIFRVPRGDSEGFEEAERERQKLVDAGLLCEG